MTEPVDPQELGRQHDVGDQPTYPPPYGQPAYGAPYPSQQPYQPPPQYGQQPYPAPPQYGPPYPAPPQYGQPYPGQAYAGYPAPAVVSAPRRRRGRIITAALVVIVVAAAVAIVLVVTSSSSSGPTASDTGPLSLPASLNNQPQITDASADRFRTEMESLFGTTGETGQLVTKGTIGVYGSTTGAATSRIILLAARSSQFPDLTPSALSGPVFGAIGTGQAYPAGSHGGAVECLATNLGQIDETECIWADKTSLGFIVAVDESLSAAAVASLTNTARDTIDH